MHNQVLHLMGNASVQIYIYGLENRFSKFLLKGVPTPTALVKITGTFYIYGPDRVKKPLV